MYSCQIIKIKFLLTAVSNMASLIALGFVTILRTVDNPEHSPDMNIGQFDQMQPFAPYGNLSLWKAVPTLIDWFWAPSSGWLQLP